MYLRVSMHLLYRNITYVSMHVCISYVQYDVNAIKYRYLGTVQINVIAAVMRLYKISRIPSFVDSLSILYQLLQSVIRLKTIASSRRSDAIGSAVHSQENLSIQLLKLLHRIHVSVRTCWKIVTCQLATQLRALLRCYVRIMQVHLVFANARSVTVTPSVCYTQVFLLSSLITRGINFT